MDEVGRYQFSDEGGTNICEENDGLWEVWANEVEGSGEDDNIEDIVDAAWREQKFSFNGLLTGSE